MVKCSIKSCSKITVDKYKLCLHHRLIGNKSNRKRCLPKPCSSSEQQCTCCGKVKDKEEFKPKGQRTELTLWCLNCRDSKKRSAINPTTEIGKCKAAWEAWQQENSKCLCCGRDDASVIEADHISVKVRACSDYMWWAWNGGVEDQKNEFYTTQPLCCFCHKIKSVKEQGVQKQQSILEKHAIINDEKVKRGGCLHCERVVTKDTVSAFYFVHRDQSTSTIYIGKLVEKSWAYFNENAGPEMAKCNLSCANCWSSNGRGKNPIKL